MFKNSRRQKDKFAPSDPYSFNIAESEYDNQITLHPPMWKKKL